MKVFVISRSRMQDRNRRPPDIAFLPGAEGFISTLPRGRRAAWVAIALPPLSHGDVATDRAISTTGWCGSFHDATYTPCIVATGRTPARARRALKAFLASLGSKDPQVERFNLRRAVREGD